MRTRLMAGCGRVAALALAIIATGCGGDAVPSPAIDTASPTGSAATSAPTTTAPSGSATASARGPRRTTAPAIALSNFQGQLRVAEDMFEARKDLGSRARLIGFLLERGQLLGRPSDLARAAKLASEATAERPAQDAQVRELRASTLIAVHRFDAGLADLEPLLKPEKPVPIELVRIQVAARAARGELEQALAVVAELRKKRPEIGILTLEGKILGAMNRTDEAAIAFDAAEASYKNPAPFALADLHFERGLVWEHQGELGKAKDAYRAALERLPQHAHAALHLAALLVPKEGVALLEGLHLTCEDPEVRGRLGELKELVEKGSGQADIAAAAAGYEAILAELPEAYADHAGWFWVGPGGDPVKAWTWAEKNLAIRPTAEAFELALAAARAAKKPEAEVCALVKRARALQWPTPRLREELAASRCE